MKMSASQAAKMARKGKDMGKPGKGFDAIVNKEKGKVGLERARKEAGAQFQKMRKKGLLQ